MRVFVPGATGFTGSVVEAELIDAGYHAVGLSLSDAGADALIHAHGLYGSKPVSFSGQ
jgi:nucleoside-diphosphate-sugar epimerase